MIKRISKLAKALKARRAPLILRPELLLGPATPKPLHETTPREIYGRKWWDATRKAAFRSTGYRCIGCGVPRSQAPFKPWLDGHEVYDVDYLLGRAEYLETVPLCRACHPYIHQGFLTHLLETREITQQRFSAIIRHGDRILREAGLTRVEYSGPYADWEDWRLILDGKEYPPKYPTEEAWNNAHEWEGSE